MDELLLVAEVVSVQQLAGAGTAPQNHVAGSALVWSADAPRDSHGHRLKEGELTGGHEPTGQAWKEG